jgi:hypothetical protein
MVGDLGIHRAANLLIRPHGEEAPTHAARRGDAMLSAGYRAGGVTSIMEWRTLAP